MPTSPPPPSAAPPARAASPLRSLLAIAAATAREALRQPICLLLGITFVAAILLLPLLLNYTLGDARRIIRDSAASLAFLGSMLLAVAVAIDAVSRDFRRGTAAVVLTRSVPRWAYALGKYLGALAPVLLFALLAALSALLAIRMSGDATHADWPVAWPALLAVPVALLVAALWNYLTSRPIPAVTLLTLLLLLILVLLRAAFRPDLDLHVFPANLDLPALAAVLLLALPAVMATALATGLAMLLRPAPAFVLAFLPFGFGLFSDPLLAARPSLLARALYAVLPNIQAFWLLDAPGIATPGPLPLPYLLPALLYALLWSLAVLLLSAALFHRREIP